MRAMWARLKKALLANRVGRALSQLIDNLDRHHAPIAASAMAFDAFLSLIPLAALAGFVLHRLHQDGTILLDPILHAAPRGVSDLISGSATRLSSDSAAVIAPVSVGAFLWVTSAGLSTAMYVFENMFWSKPRPWYWRRAIATLCVIAAIAIIAVVAAAAVGSAMLSPLLGRLVAIILPTATIIGMLMAFFRIAVRRDHVFRRRRVVPGVLITVVLWSILSALFSFYVTTLSRYATLYGGLAAVAIFLFWLWLLALALLVGGEVNAQLDGVRAFPAEQTPLGPAPSSRAAR
jgi:membrane protein